MPYEVGHGLSYRVNVRWLIFVSSRKFVLVCKPNNAANSDISYDLDTNSQHYCCFLLLVPDQYTRLQFGFPLGVTGVSTSNDEQGSFLRCQENTP